MRRLRTSLAAGFALLEVMVALLVITTGLAGMASLGAQHIAGRAQDADQLRALRLAADAVAILSLLPPDDRSATPAGAACGAAPCPTARFAPHALAEWRRRVQRELPQGAGQLTLATQNAGVRVTLSWQRAGQAQQLALEAGL